VCGLIRVYPQAIVALKPSSFLKARQIARAIIVALAAPACHLLLLTAERFPNTITVRLTCSRVRLESLTC
jgi:hypothetical protein